MTPRTASEPRREAAAIDPITTEVIRHGLSSAAMQMKQGLVRTSFSPIIYESLDFAAALYDRQVRMLAQSPSLPLFMGTLSFCVEAAVEGVGGEGNLEAGDVILLTDPFKTGSHPQDAAMVAPVFVEGELIGYSAIKAHWMDLGAKDPLYCTDSTEVFQEGVVFPGVKIQSAGEPVDDIVRIALANSRMPEGVGGDINAQMVGLNLGSEGLVRLVQRYGAERFLAAVERIYDHGEAVTRSFYEQLPDGRWVAEGQMDDNGIADDPVPFEVTVEIDGSQVTVDFSAAPDQLDGPMNCPIASTVSAARVPLTMLAGSGEGPNEGHFRPIEVRTRPGSVFEPLPPAASFFSGWSSGQAAEAVIRALAQATPGLAVADSGGDYCSALWWGVRESGEFWGGGGPNMVGRGAREGMDGPPPRMFFVASETRISSVEVIETRAPWVTLRHELAPDSGGPGRWRGGPGVDVAWEVYEDASVTPMLERTKTSPQGVAGGLPARPNSGELRLPDGTARSVTKETGLPAPRGTVLEFRTGGGGGFGAPGERDPEAVRADLEDELITPEHAREHYPHVPG